MDIAALITLFVVLSVLAVAGYGLFEVSPFARHGDGYRDRRTGRRFESPHLETRDEFEQRTHDDLA